MGPALLAGSIRFGPIKARIRAIEVWWFVRPFLGLSEVPGMGLFGHLRSPDSLALMLVSGWIYKWDLHSVSEVGGSGIADDICVHDGVRYEAGPGGGYSWGTPS